MAKRQNELGKMCLYRQLHLCNRIRRALAQSVTDHWHSGKGKQTKTSAMTNVCCFRFHLKIHNCLEMDSEMTIPGKESEMDSEMSSCCCFLLRLLFLVKKTAHARGAVREPPGLSIVTHQRLEDTLFLKRFLEPFLSPKIGIFNANGTHYGTKRKSFGSYF